MVGGPFTGGLISGGIALLSVQTIRNSYDVPVALVPDEVQEPFQFVEAALPSEPTDLSSVAEDGAVEFADALGVDDAVVWCSALALFLGGLAFRSLWSRRKLVEEKMNPRLQESSDHLQRGIENLREKFCLAKKSVSSSLSSTKSHEDDAKAVGQLLAAWQEVGAAEDSFSQKVFAAAESLGAVFEADAKSLQELRQQCAQAIEDLVEKLKAATEPVVRRVTPRHMDSKIKEISLALGSKANREAFQEKHDQQSVIVHEEIVIVLVPPLKTLPNGTWQISDFYVHMGAKIGLRCLDRDWNTDELFVFPQDGKTISKQSTFERMLRGELFLKSMIGNEISACQSDLVRLSLRQLLRLCVLHIDFTPSGCGSNTVHGAQGHHESFMNTLNGLVFKRLGTKAMVGLQGLELADLESNSWQLGHYAVLFKSASEALSEHAWWSWRLPFGDHRVFFNPSEFNSLHSFPEDSGVYVMTDLSKRDKHEPTGHLMWMDWRIEAVTTQDGLNAAVARGESSRNTRDVSPRNARLPKDSGPSTEELMSRRSMLRKTHANDGIRAPVVEAQV